MKIAKLLNYNYRKLEWVLVGSDYEGLEWIYNLTKPNKTEPKFQQEKTQGKIIIQKNNKTDAPQPAIVKFVALGLTEEEIGAL
jgi:hypothetical protein